MMGRQKKHRSTKQWSEHGKPSTIRSPITVLFIMGYGRSGSTIIEKVLDTLHDVTSCGEVEYLFERGLLKNELCSCGVRANCCQFWRRPLSKLKDNIRNIYHGDQNAYLKEKRKNERLLSVFFRFWRGRCSSDYCRLETDTLLAIANNSGTKILVDSSKSPGRALALMRCERIDVKILHLVRDSRAVSYSWRKLKRRPEVTTSVEYMPRYSIIRSAFYWLVYNTASLIVTILARERVLVKKYEDICNKPDLFVRELRDFIGVNTKPLLPILRGEVNICSNSHMISGNPIRLKKDIKFSIDEKWTKNLNGFQKIIVTAITFPLLKIYGYKI